MMSALTMRNATVMPPHSLARPRTCSSTPASDSPSLTSPMTFSLEAVPPVRPRAPSKSSSGVWVCSETMGEANSMKRWPALSTCRDTALEDSASTGWAATEACRPPLASTRPSPPWMITYATSGLRRVPRMATRRSWESSLSAPSSLAKPRLAARACPRFSNSSVTSRRCSRMFIHAWKTRKPTTMGTTDQNTRARKLEKPRNGSRMVIRSLDDVGGATEDGLGNLQAELLRRLQVDGQGDFPRVGVGHTRRGLSGEDGLGELAGLAPNVLPAREGKGEQGAHLRVAIGETEEGNALAIGEEEHLLHHGLGERGLVWHDPQRVDTVLHGLEGAHHVLGRVDLARDQLEPFLLGCGLRLAHEVARAVLVVDNTDALDLRAELLEEPDGLLYRHVHAGAGDVLAVCAEHTGRIEDHGVDDGRGGRPAHHGLQRPDPHGEDEVGLHLLVDLRELLAATVEIAVHVVDGDDGVRRGLAEALERVLVLGDLGAQKDGHARRLGGRREDSEREEDSED